MKHAQRGANSFGVVAGGDAHLGGVMAGRTGRKVDMTDKKKTDRHRSRRAVRIPIEFHEVIDALASKSGRPVTIEIQDAIILAARRAGVDCPVVSTRNVRPVKSKPVTGVEAK